MFGSSRPSYIINKVGVISGMGAIDPYIQYKVAKYNYST